MIRNLTIVAVASFVLALGCFGGAAALGGRDFLKNGWRLPADWHVEINDDDHVNIRSNDALSDADQESIDRDIAWAGAETLRIDLPAEVVYTQAAPGAGAAVKVSGPRYLVDRVVVDGDRIRLKDGGDGFHISRRHDQLTIEVTAPAVRRFTLNGSGDLRLRAYDQPSLALEINGSGDAEAEGKAQKVELRISGSGEADLSALDGGDVDVALAGSGSARIAPHGAAKVEVAGSGEVNVTTKPTSLSTDIAGSGEVNQNW
jgi:hypothetical protein